MKTYYTHTAAPRMPKGDRVVRAIRDFIVLSILEWRNLYGAELANEYERTTGEQVTAASMYSVLHRLRDLHWIVLDERRTDAPDTAKPYRVTDTGARVLAKLRRFTYRL